MLPDLRAVDDAGTTPVGTPLVVPAAEGLLTNDIGGDLAVVSTTAPKHGTVTTNPDGSFTYTPVAGFTGTDQFDYTVTDERGRIDVGTVILTVTPFAVDDTWTTPVNTPRTVPAPGVLGNDLGDDLTAGSASDPPHGSVVLDPSGALVYRPDQDFSGTDTFTYVASTGSLSDEATVTIVVTPAAADDDLGTVPANVTTTGTLRGVLTNDAGSDLTVTDVGTPAHGTVTIAPDGSWSYTPPLGWGGTDTFTYTATDGEGQTAQATVTIRVTVPAPPTAADDTATGVRDQPTTVTELTNDSPGDNLAWDLTTVRLTDPVTGLPATTVTVPGEGTWTVEPGQVRFTPVAGFHGDAHLDYEVTNTAGQTVTATMTVTYPPLSAPPIVVVPTSVTPTTPTAPPPVTTTTTGRGGPAGLATTGADPFPALLLAFSLVVAGVALSRFRRA